MVCRGKSDIKGKDSCKMSIIIKRPTHYGNFRPRLYILFTLLAVVCSFPARAICLQELVVGDSHVSRMAEVAEPALSKMLR